MWLRLLIILNFSFLIFNCHSYGQRPIGIAFYDVDRIYDTVPALFYDDADYTPEGRLHWTAERYARKIRNTAAVIDSMALPLVALWGVENEQVVRDIAAACRGDYSYLHRTLNSLDGMDFALLYYASSNRPCVRQSGLFHQIPNTGNHVSFAFSYPAVWEQKKSHRNNRLLFLYCHISFRSP